MVTPAPVAVATTYSITASVTGLGAGKTLVLQNGADSLSFTSNTSSSFATKLATGAGYAITVKTNPVGQSCGVTNGSATVAGANVTTQVLKMLVFRRDDLLGLGAWNGTNTLPSGHTTVAAAGLVGLMLVVPPWLRSITTALGVVGVSAYGFATLVNHWHRPSDVAAAVLVACGWGGLGVAVIRLAEHLGPRRDVAHRPGAMSVILVTLSICSLALCVAAGFLAWGTEPQEASSTIALIAYIGGIAALVGVTFGGFGALLRLLDATRPMTREQVRDVTAAGQPG